MLDATFGAGPRPIHPSFGPAPFFADDASGCVRRAAMKNVSIFNFFESLYDSAQSENAGARAQWVTARCSR